MFERWTPRAAFKGWNPYNDGVSSNPPGRDSSDFAIDANINHNRIKFNAPNPASILLLGPKKSLLMSAFNVTHLRDHINSNKQKEEQNKTWTLIIIDYIVIL